MSKLNRTDTSAAGEYATVYVAFELSKAKWKLGVMLPGSQKMSRYTINGGDLAALSERLATWRARAEATSKPVRIISCYEAGYDGHWLHRWLTGVRARLKAGRTSSSGRASGSRWQRAGAAWHPRSPRPW